MSRLFETAIGFEHGFVEKVSFILLSYLDFVFTLFAMRLGFSELNPLMQRALEYPGAFFLVKIVASLFIASLVPGKLLLPAIVFMFFIVGWDARELIFYFI